MFARREHCASACLSMNEPPSKAAPAVSWRSLMGSALCVCFAVALASCVLFDDSGPENARMLIGFEGGEPGAGNNLRLIVSNNFATSGQGQGQTDITLSSSDTVQLTLPFEQQYSLGTNSRFFAQIANLDSIPVVLSIKVDLDGDVRMDQVTALGEPVEFLYVLTEF